MPNAVAIDRLAELEAIIERGVRSFVEVGNALAEVRDSRLYLTSNGGAWPTFESYVAERWGWERRQAYRYIAAAGVQSNVSSETHLRSIESAELLAPLPAERQRELAPAIAEMTVREARQYVRAAEAPIQILDEPEVPARESEALRDMTAALNALVRLASTVESVQMEATPEQYARLRRLAQRARRVVADLDHDIIRMEVQ